MTTNTSILITSLGLCLTLLLSCNEPQATVPSASKAIPEATTTLPNKPPRALTEATLDLSKYGIANNPDNALGGLQVGDVAPDFMLQDHTGKAINLYKQTAAGPVILVFYRAHWCGYCTRSLAALQSDLARVKDKGASVLAISPEQSKWAKQVAQDEGLAYPLLHDEGHTVSKAYMNFFHVTPQYDDKLAKALEKNIADVNGDESSMMPVPATYVIGQDNKVKYVFYNPDYAQRAPIDEVLKAL